MLDLFRNPNCWFSHAQVQIIKIKLRSFKSSEHHYENKSMQYTKKKKLFVKMKIFIGKKYFSYFLVKTNRFWVYVRTASQGVLTSNHNLCFGAKIRKKTTGIPLHTPVSLYKSGV